MIKETKIIGLCIILILLSGCVMNKSHTLDFNSTSSSDCLSECDKLLNDFGCLEGFPSYETNFINNIQSKGTCSCYVRECFK